MSVKQGFMHIIVYDKGSVKEAIVDALQGKNSTGVYFRSEDVADNNALVQQFVSQLLLHEGSWRNCA